MLTASASSTHARFRHGCGGGWGDRLPQRLPFSRTVPESLQEILAFQTGYYDFLVGFPSGYTEFDELISHVRHGRFLRQTRSPRAF